MITKSICPNCFSHARLNENYCMNCGSSIYAARDSGTLPAGLVLHNKYIIGKVLGSGGFGITYLAFDMHMAVRCAIKEYYPKEWAVRRMDGVTTTPINEKTQGWYEHGMETFLNEGNILSSLQAEPNIVNVYYVFKENGTAYLVMEYVEGKDLACILQEQNRPMELTEARQIIRCVAASLNTLHRKGYLHRDVSPDNIMICRDGKVKLIDFGATRHYAKEETNTMSVVVKQGFAPLEQYSASGRQGTWTDVYALAATYCYLLTGRKLEPAVERMSHSMDEEVAWLRCKRPEVSEILARVIFCALRVNYQDRTPDMATFIAGIDEASKYSDEVIRQEIYLTLIQKDLTRQWRFFSGQEITVGRSKGNVILMGKTVSGEHCKILYDTSQGQFIVKDLSKNGTYCNGRKIGRGNQILIPPGSYIDIVSEVNRMYLEVK